MGRIGEMEDRNLIRGLIRTETIYSIILTIILTIALLIILALVTLYILANLKNQVNKYESECSRMSINEYEDNCYCPCDKPTWLEKKLHLYKTCDGWIVKKNEPCLSGINRIN